MTGEMPLRHGVHQALEDAANELIRESLQGVTSMAAKKDILTPWKEQDRKNREVLVSSGVPDASTRQGMFHRAWNSEHAHLNSRDGIARGYRFADTGASHAGRESVGLGDHLGEAGWD